MNAKAISFTPEVLKAKLRALEEYGLCQTRRPVLPNAPNKRAVANVGSKLIDGRLWVEPGGWVRPPFGTIGQRLWILERARVLEWATGGLGRMARLAYELDNVASPWLPYPSRLKEPVVGRCIPNGVHREGARHFLEVADVRAERLHGVTEEDARLEGFDRRLHFLKAFDSIYGEDITLADPWCWVYTLKRTDP